MFQKLLIIIITLAIPVVAVCQTQEEIDAKKARIEQAIKNNPDKAAEYQKMLDDLNKMKPGENRPTSAAPTSAPDRGASNSGTTQNAPQIQGRTMPGRTVVIDGITYTNDSLPGPLYVTLEWLTDPVNKKPSKANIDAIDLKAIRDLVGEERYKQFQNKLNNARSANEAMSLLGTLRFYTKQHSSDTNPEGWQRTSYLMERIIPVKF